MGNLVVGSRAWAQEQIQSIYKQFGIDSDDFEIILLWYLGYLAAEKEKTLHNVNVDDLRTFHPRPIFITLPEFVQEIVSNFWFRLMKVKGHTIRERWEDRGIPIYN